MRKIALLVLSILTVAALLCGCANTAAPAPAEQPSTSATPSATVAPSTPSQTEDLPGQVYFGHGVYQVFINDEFNGDYYIFYDTESGKTANANTGMGLGFTCEQTDGQVTFHMGGPENTVVMKMTGEGNRFVGTTEEKKQYTFAWVEGDPDTFDATKDGVKSDAGDNGDGQNPIMNFIGDYSNGRAIMTVASAGKDEAKFTVTWGGSATENSKWVMSGKCALDDENLTVAYADCVKTSSVYDSTGALVSETKEYENGTGKIVIDLETSQITWTDDQDDINEVFTWLES